jgi:hypothetical protein
VEEIFQYDMAPIPKIASCVTLFIVTFFFGILPCGIVRILNRRIPKSTSQQKYMSWMNCFAGGVFFAIPHGNIPKKNVTMNKVTHEAIFGIGAISY